MIQPAVAASWDREKTQMTVENLAFHVIVDHAQKSFFINCADQSNGIWLHYEMNRVAREQGKTLRDFDMRAPSQEAALSELQSFLTGYSFLGAWTPEASRR
jgi:hypothetical protein